MRTHYTSQAGVACIRMDDDKVNVMSEAMQNELRDAFERAGEERAAVVLLGRPNVFSAGFDLKVLQGDAKAALRMVRGGFELARTILEYPYPVVAACAGHAVAMGAFLLFSADYRIGASGDYRLTANEVALGLAVPRPALAILRHRLTPSAFERAAILAEPFGPSNAIEVGFLDRIVSPDALEREALEIAGAARQLNLAAHGETKRRCRRALLAEIDAGIEADFG